LYLVEGTQAGIFELANIPAEQMDALLGIVCPTMLYPYLRANVADAITRTSLPALHLAEVNFQALYEQRLAELAQQQGGNNNGSDAGIILPPGTTRLYARPHEPTARPPERRRSGRGQLGHSAGRRGQPPPSHRSMGARRRPGGRHGQHPRERPLPAG